MKSEPETWSWEQQKKKKTEHWDGVRNYQASNYMKQMKIKDELTEERERRKKCKECAICGEEISDTNSALFLFTCLIKLCDTCRF